jgi:hypothetical protein
MIDQLRQAAQQALDAIHLFLWAGDKHLLQDAHEALRTTLLQPPLPVHKLRRGDILRCIETDELCTVWATSTTGKTLIKWSANNFGNYTADQIGELFWIEPREAEPAPQRTWVGLTEFQFAEIYNKWNDSNGSTPWALNQALEAKLKELKK